MNFYLVTLTLQVDQLLKKMLWTMTFDSEGLLIVAIYIWFPLASDVVFLSTLVDVNGNLLYFKFLSHLFPLLCGAGSTVPCEGFDSSVIIPFSWCVVAVTLPI